MRAFDGVALAVRSHLRYVALAGLVVSSRWAWPGLRVVVAWLAGANRMHWPRFLVWNALGAISWAVTVGLAAFLLSAAGEKLVASAGAAAAVAVGLAVAALFSALACADADGRTERDDVRSTQGVRACRSELRITG